MTATAIRRHRHRRRPRRLPRRDPRRAARPEDRLHRRRARQGRQARARRHLPPRRLHPVQGAARFVEPVLEPAATCSTSTASASKDADDRRRDDDRPQGQDREAVHRRRRAAVQGEQDHAVLRLRQAAAGQRRSKVKQHDGSEVELKGTNVDHRRGFGFDRTAVREVRRAHRRQRRRARFRQACPSASA